MTLATRCITAGMFPPQVRLKGRRIRDVRRKQERAGTQGLFSRERFEPANTQNHTLRDPAARCAISDIAQAQHGFCHR